MSRVAYTIFGLVNTTHPSGRSATVAATVAALLVTLSPDAEADDDPCHPRDGFSTCIGADNLWPQVGGGRWFSQAATATAPASSAAFGIVPTYYLRPIGLRISSTDPEGTTIYAVDNAIAATFLIGIGVTDRVQVQIATPVVLFQDGASKTDIVGSTRALPRSAVGDMRFGVAVEILERAPLASGPALTARFEMAAPTGQDDAFVGYATSTYAPGLAFDYRIGAFSAGVDAGVRIRDYVTLAGAIIGTQISGSVGVGYDFLDDDMLSANLEAWALFNVLQQNELTSQPGQFTADEEPSDVPHIPAEWMLSVRTAGLLDGRFRASLGGGSFIPTSGDGLPVTTPAFRLALGLHYVYSLGADE